MIRPDFTKPNPEFDKWKATMPETHWAKYDLSACRLGWEAALAFVNQRPTSNVQHPTFNGFEALCEQYLQWVRETFPGETAEEQLTHLCEEFTELVASPFLPEEYADVLMLLLCVARGNGVDVIEAFRTKFEVNKARRWEKTDRGFRHVRERETSSREG